MSPLELRRSEEPKDTKLTLFCLTAKSKKQRKLAAKKLRKAALDPAAQTKKVPIEHQSIDLPAGNAKESLKAREELTDAMRTARRKGIKEANFLRSM